MFEMPQTNQPAGAATARELIGDFDPLSPDLKQRGFLLLLIDDLKDIGTTLREHRARIGTIADAVFGVEIDPTARKHGVNKFDGTPSEPFASNFGNTMNELQNLLGDISYQITRLEKL